MDLIADMPSRRDVAALLKSMMDIDPDPPSLPNDVNASPMDPLLTRSRSRHELLHLHRTMKSRQSAARNRRIRRREEEQARDAWLMDSLHAAAMGEGSEYVCFAFERERRRAARFGAGAIDVGNEDDVVDDSDEVDEDESGSDQQTSQQHPPRTIDLTDDVDDTTLLVFSLDTLSTKLSHLITSYPPQAYPLSRRTLPANSIYLFTRYAAYRAVDPASARANLAGLLEMVMLEVERVCMVSRAVERAASDLS